MRILPKLPLLAGAALACAPALAQTAAQTGTPPGPTAAPAAVSDEEVTKFAGAALAVDKVRKDPAVADADKQAQMTARIREQGLDPARFNEIAAAFQSDAALQVRIQAEIAKQTPAQ